MMEQSVERRRFHYSIIPLFHDSPYAFMKNVVLLGSTGSIGISTIKVAEDLPDKIRLLGLGAGNNAELLLEQTRKLRPEAVSIIDRAKAKELSGALGTTTRVFSGEDGLLK